MFLAALVVVGCSGDDDAAADPASTSTDAVESPATDGGAESLAPTTTAASDPGDPTIASSPPTEPIDTTATTATSTGPSLVAIPETGVPGLDSDDRFCSAWSRFGGSWQVLLVGSTFLGDPERVAEWEVAASTVVGPAYDDLIATLPDELADEADAVADGYFGVLDRRLAVAEAALASAGADDEGRAELRAAWIEALAGRDPTTPDLDFTVPEALGSIVTDAAAELRSQRVEFHVDPSMIVDVATPLTDAYLETTCPDRGTLTGQEIDPDG